MTKKLIHAFEDERGKLRCDNSTCRHVLAETLPWGAHLIGYPCPKCGESMLTAKDFHDSEKMTAAIAWLNKWFGWLGTKEPEGTTFAIRNHDGRVEIKR